MKRSEGWSCLDNVELCTAYIQYSTTVAQHRSLPLALFCSSGEWLSSSSFFFFYLPNRYNFKSVVSYYHWKWDFNSFVNECLTIFVRRHYARESIITFSGYLLSTTVLVSKTTCQWKYSVGTHRGGLVHHLASSCECWLTRVWQHLGWWVRKEWLSLATSTTTKTLRGPGSF